MIGRESEELIVDILEKAEDFYVPVKKVSEMFKKGKKDRKTLIKNE